MINEIKIRDFASFKNETPISFIVTDKAGNEGPAKLCLLYGPNGTGKTTITKVIQESATRSDSSDNYEVLHEMDSEYGEKVFVYNSVYVKENFEISDIQNGIFSLGAENVQAQQTIDTNRKRIENLKTDKLNKENSLTNIQQEISDLDVSAKDKIYEICKKHKKDSSLSFCLDKIQGTKGLFWNAVVSKKLKPDVPTFDELESLANQLKDNATEKPVLASLPSCCLNINRIESDTLWKKCIIPIGESCYNNLVSKLNNQDWVKQGLTYIKNSDGLCPFCQQRMPANLKKDISAIFDEEYDRSVAQMANLHKEYCNAIDELDSYIKRNLQTTGITKADSLMPIFRASLASLVAAMRKNEKLMNTKILTPSLIVNILSSSNLYANAINDVESINEEIGNHNTLVKEIETTRSTIKQNFLLRARLDSDEQLQAYQKESARLKSLSLSISDEIEQLQRDINTCNKSINEALKLVKNVEDAVISINNTLHLIGITGFRIEKSSSDSEQYQLVRENESSNGVFIDLTILNNSVKMLPCVRKEPRQKGRGNI